MVVLAASGAEEGHPPAAFAGHDFETEGFLVEGDGPRQIADVEDGVVEALDGDAHGVTPWPLLRGGETGGDFGHAVALETGGREVAFFGLRALD